MNKKDVFSDCKRDPNMSFIPQDPIQKIATAKLKKEAADNAFKQGDLQGGT